MSLQLVSALDRTLIHQRLGSVKNEPDWGGDDASAYTAVPPGDPIPCRYEVTDIDQYTVWVFDNTNEFLYKDRVVIDGVLTLEVIRVQTWTNLRGKFSHYELAAMEIATERQYVDG